MTDKPLEGEIMPRGKPPISPDVLCNYMKRIFEKEIIDGESVRIGAEMIENE